MGITQGRLQKQPLSLHFLMQPRSCLNSARILQWRYASSKTEDTESELELRRKCKEIGAVVTRCTSNDNASPIAVILGWNSSTDRNLAKYSEIFETKKFDTVRIGAKPLNTFVRLNTKGKKISLKLLEILILMRRNEPGRPFFIYSLSMGGFNIYYQISKAVVNPRHQFHAGINIIGTIIDSSPHFPGFKSIEGAISTTTEVIKNPFARAAVSVGMTLISPIVLFSPACRKLIPESMELPLLSSQLFLYSKADKLVDYKEVKTFIKARESVGVKVFSKCWEESAHVDHFRMHKEEYLEKVNVFVDYCLLEHNSKKGNLE